MLVVYSRMVCWAQAVDGIRPLDTMTRMDDARRNARDIDALRSLIENLQEGSFSR
jgi:hypothetical protein